MKSVETQMILDTFPEPPEIHPGVDFRHWPWGRGATWPHLGAREKGPLLPVGCNNTYGASVPEP
jgi:hypothetical protein